MTTHYGWSASAPDSPRSYGGRLRRALCSALYGAVKDHIIVPQPPTYTTAAGLLVAADCPACMAMHVEAQLQDKRWVQCSDCGGTGLKAHKNSPVTSCFSCGNLGVQLVVGR